MDEMKNPGPETKNKDAFLTEMFLSKQALLQTDFLPSNSVVFRAVHGTNSTEGVGWEECLSPGDDIFMK